MKASFLASTEPSITGTTVVRILTIQSPQRFVPQHTVKHIHNVDTYSVVIAIFCYIYLTEIDEFSHNRIKSLLLVCVFVFPA
jgi:hypothetical protein